ncbi:MAG TPA: Qat anti-phage system QueC-like protein QatC [Solirubrobacterales bacterium]
MIRVRTRTDSREASGPATMRLLDWFGGPDERTVSFGGSYFEGPRLPAAAEDLLRFAGSVYCADRIVGRSRGDDRWTREITLEVGFSRPDSWNAASEDLLAAIRFLSGDHWSLRIRRGKGGLRAVREMPAQQTFEDFDAVCLFSGGLDSLCGALHLLDQGHSLILLGHYEAGLASRRQSLLAASLTDRFGAERVRLHQLRLGPASSASGQARPLENDNENTTRARSLLFIAAGISLAHALGPAVPLYVPENGFIGINVPLRGSRTGSSSTRTTHPWFLDRLLAALQTLGIDNPIENPFVHATKGEVLSSVDSAVLSGLAPTALSCAHPEALRWIKVSGGNCGSCLPCIIRRAGMHKVGLDDPDDYAFDPLREEGFLDPNRGRAADALAVFSSLRSSPGPLAIFRNGTVPWNQANAFREVHRRGLDELRSWIEAQGSSEVRAMITVS